MTSRRLQITLQPEVLRWARERAGFECPELVHKLKVSPGARVGVGTQWRDQCCAGRQTRPTQGNYILN